MSTTTIYVNDPSPTRIDVNTPRINVTVSGGQPGPPGPPGPPGTGGSTLVTGETPSGVKNGTNLVFTIAQMPLAGSVSVYRNGLRERSGVGYSMSGSTITFTTAPLPTDELTTDYLLEE